MDAAGEIITVDVDDENGDNDNDGDGSDAPDTNLANEPDLAFDVNQAAHHNEDHIPRDDDPPNGDEAGDALDDVMQNADVEAADRGEGDAKIAGAWPTDDDDTTAEGTHGVDNGSNDDEVGNTGVDNGDGFLDDTADEGAEDTAQPEEGGEDEPFLVPRYHLRGRRERNYSHRLDHQMDASTSGKSYDAQQQLLQAGKCVPRSKTEVQYIFGHIMTQMTATAGIKKHGQKAIDAMLKEFCQLDDKSVFAAVDATKLSSAQRFAALRAINLIKEKRDGVLKGRSCADGSLQRSLYTKEQSASPTVSTDALMLSLMIDVKERWDVATADVVGAYLLADMDEYVLLKLSGESVESCARSTRSMRVSW